MRRRRGEKGRGKDLMESNNRITCRREGKKDITGEWEREKQGEKGEREGERTVMKGRGRWR